MKLISSTKSLLLATSAAAALALPVTAQALPSQTTTVGNRTLALRYCWQTSTFNPRCPASNLPLWADGSIGGRAGAVWTETPTSITMDMVNPSPGVLRTTYYGTRTGSTTQVCFTGTMTADRANLPGTVDMSGVWQGCIQ